MSVSDHILVRGAAEHNLKNIDVEIPHGCLTVVTGLSGSGKSSLAFDIICQEGQRRFVESLSAYARQYLGKLDKPKVEHIEGLSPTISIDQKTVSRNPRSTVGTITEILDYLRLLYARLGVPHCPRCQARIESRTVDQIVESTYLQWPESEILITAPIVLERKGEYRKELAELRAQGFVRVRIDGTVRRLDEEIRLARYERHTIEVVYDRLVLEASRRSRVAEAIEKALEVGKGLINIVVAGESHLRSSHFACPRCNVDLPELEPRLFSFNSPQGSCRYCDGIGHRQVVDLKRLVPDASRSLRAGALANMTAQGTLTHTGVSVGDFAAADSVLGFDTPVDIDRPWRKLPAKLRERILFGDGAEATNGARANRPGRERRRKHGFAGIVRLLEEKWRSTEAPGLARWLTPGTCSDCEGTRLRPEARAVLFEGKSIATLASLSVAQAHEFIARLTFTAESEPIGAPIAREIVRRLAFLERVGLGYLALDRGANTLAGGEAQRIRLAAQLGSGLRGVLYVLDEPSIGLHPRDQNALLATLRELRDLGNTVLVVEHDRETIEAADHLVDIGPGAGVHGGEMVAEGTVADLSAAPRSLTGLYLSGKEKIEAPRARRRATSEKLMIRGARQHNLRDLDVEIPLHMLTVITGVSGSGKSTLIDHVLYRAAAQRFGLEVPAPGAHDEIVGLEQLDKVVRIDQSPIGRTPRSNPGTYTKVFDEIRELYALTADARVRGYGAGRFSFNVAGGRCEHCSGAGVITISMQFLADVDVVCEECGGRRYNAETLEITYRGRSIAEILALPISAALEFFADHPKIQRTLALLNEVGLGYVELGQPSTTLSGGEAQRVKLAYELRRQATGRTLYLLDEPTTGLHFADIRRLLDALQRLVDAGNTVVIIEHNLDVVRVADHVIDLGPDGGADGGRVVAEGTPEEVAKSSGATGAALALALRGRRAPELRGGKRRRAKRSDPDDRFVIEGAREHNLKNVTVEIPRGALTVVTGPSGSGKSTLAFDVLFAEGQRRYVESLSTYARRFLGRMRGAAVDRVRGIAPAIAIDQRNRGASPRSTVATATEIYDYLRILFARAGTPHCPECDVKLEATSASQVARAVEEEFAGDPFYLLAPLHVPGAQKNVLPASEMLPAVAGDLMRDGFARVLVGGEERRLEEFDGNAAAAPAAGVPVELVIDRFAGGKASRGRIAESTEEAYRRGHGRVVARRRGGGAERVFTRLPACPSSHYAQDEELSPRLFSFNHHSGACPRCHGLGVHRDASLELLVTDGSRPLFRGAMEHRVGKWLRRPRGRVRKVVTAAFAAHGYDLLQPASQLDAGAITLLLDGSGERVYDVRFRAGPPGHRHWQTKSTWEGLRSVLRRWHERASSPAWRSLLEERMGTSPCSLCGGGRLRRELLCVRFAGRNVHEICTMSIQEARRFFAAALLTARERQVGRDVLRELDHRLGFLVDVGLDYLTLDRAAETLSGGESQRIRLATQIGNRLVGVLYVLDEPTVGLHPRDTERLLESLTRLRDLGNSVVVVEHDELTIRRADHVIDLGPGAGRYGGYVVAAGTPAAIASAPNSTTGRFLAAAAQAAPARKRRQGSGARIEILAAAANNLKSLDLCLPAGTLTVVTGVSGSGKSTLVMDVLARAAARRFHAARALPGKHLEIRGFENFDDVAVIDQAPLGGTPKANPATYTGLWTPIRELFAKLPQSKARGFDKGRFSFNVAGGRCEFCEGKGSLLVEMHFLSDVWVPCEVCRGRRFNKETLEIRYRGLTIADVLDLEVGAAGEFFANHPQLAAMLQTLEDVGLGYIALGQASNTLSGGEAQRVKLARELGRTRTARMLYLLDEPTTGLHFVDVEKLLPVLHRLVERGNTVVVIEHNIEVILAADHVIDLGPEGGDAGGQLVAQGTPEAIAASAESHTGKFLRARLA